MGIVTKSIGTSGRDYSTLQAWEDALPANLVTDGNSQVGECYNDSEFTAAGRLLLISGETTDATHTITLRCGSGQSFRDNVNVQTNALRYNATNGVALRSTASNAGYTVEIGAQFVTIDGLQISNPNAAVLFRNTGANWIFKNCIVEGNTTAASGYNAAVFEMDSNGVGTNSIIINRLAGFDGILASVGAGGMSLVNITCVKPSDLTANNVAFNLGYGGTLKNCAGFGFNTFSAGSLSGNNNCSDKAISFGTGNQASKTYANQFQNTLDATRDFRLKIGSDCIDTGVTDTINIPSSDDIAKTIRPSGTAWDIGAWELVLKALFAQSLM